MGLEDQPTLGRPAVSTATETVVKRLSIAATVVGLSSALAFLFVARGVGQAPAKVSPPAAATWRALPAPPIGAALDPGGA